MSDFDVIHYESLESFLQVWFEAHFLEEVNKEDGAILVVEEEDGIKLVPLHLALKKEYRSRSKKDFEEKDLQEKNNDGEEGKEPSKADIVGEEWDKLESKDEESGSNEGAAVEKSELPSVDEIKDYILGSEGYEHSFQEISKHFLGFAISSTSNGKEYQWLYHRIKKARRQIESEEELEFEKIKEGQKSRYRKKERKENTCEAAGCDNSVGENNDKFCQECGGMLQ